MRVTPLTFFTFGMSVAAMASLPARQASKDVTSFALQVQPLASLAGDPSGQPQLSVSNRGVLLSWIERADGRAILKFAERTPQGWSPARVVASGDNWFVNWADVPSVLRLSDGRLAAHWLQKSAPDTYAYDVRLSYSKDDGKTWSPSVTPHHDGTKTEHGFASLFEVPGAGLGSVWLDGRAMAPGGHEAGGAHGGAMTLRSATFDRAGKQTSEHSIDVRVCECCPTTAVMTADGPIVAFRDRSETEIRDIHVSRFENGRWTESKAVHADNWQISSCPVTGPMLSARGRDVAIAWFSGHDKQNRAFVAFSKDAGRTFGAPIRLDDAGTFGRVDIELLSDGSALASWIEIAGEQAEFRVRRVAQTGGRSAPVTVARVESSRASGYPRMAVHGDEVVFAWITGRPLQSSPGAGVRVLTAFARLPLIGAK